MSLKVLVGCEFSGRVTDAFRALNHEAYSCDLVATEGDPLYHIQDDLLYVAKQDSWDLLVAFPPCTYLAISGRRWFNTRQQEQLEAIEFVTSLYELPINHIVIENPIGVLSSRWKKPDQIIHPWQYGHPFTKATCLWLKNLPHLRPTKILPRIYQKNGFLVDGRKQTIANKAQVLDRTKYRSRTFNGIAKAMAAQYSTYICATKESPPVVVRAF